MVIQGPRPLETIFTYASVVNRTGEGSVENQAQAVNISTHITRVTLLRKVAKASKKAISDSKEKNNSVLCLGGELEYL